VPVGSYNDFWLVHETLLEEAQKLRSEVITFRSGVQVESARRRLGVENRSPEGPSSRPEGWVVSLGDQPIGLRALEVSMRELRDRGSDPDGNDGANPLLYG